MRWCGTSPHIAASGDKISWQCSQIRASGGCRHRSLSNILRNGQQRLCPICVRLLNSSAVLIRRIGRVWINEARDSDLKFVRQYIDFVDITGCDDYPIRADGRPAIRLADSTDRWRQVGKDRPVWMVLQGFTWNDLDDEHGDVAAFPTFDESRLMAYVCITHGARGILYWGSNYIKSEGKEAFRKSLYALTSELAALQPFLTAPIERYVTVQVIDDGRTDVPIPASMRGVSITARRIGRDWLIVLVNEDEHAYMGVEVTGLRALNGTEFVELYGDEKTAVSDGSFVTRMRPFEVKLFATHRKWETTQREGREFAE